MQVRVEQLGEAPVFKIAGDLDHASAPKVTELLEEQLPDIIEGPVFLDVTDVPYVDSAGLSMLSRVLARCRADGWVGVIGPNKEVFRMFEISGVTTRQALVIARDPYEARRQLEERKLPRAKKERPRRQRLLDHEEDEWEDEEEPPAGGEEPEPVWGEGEGESPWGKSRSSGW